MIPVPFLDQKFARWTPGEDGANFCSTTLVAKAALTLVGPLWFPIR
jgi:hypothetical protein